MINYLIKLLNRTVDPFILNIGDLEIANKFWDYPPEPFVDSFLNEFIARREGLSLDNKESIIINILSHRDNQYIWDRCKETSEIDESDPQVLFSEFRDRMRGFKDCQLEECASDYRIKIKNYISKIEPITKKIENLLKEAKNLKNRGKVLYLSNEFDEFKKVLTKYRKQLDESSLVRRAAAKLRRETFLFKGISTIIGFFRDFDIIPPLLKLSTLDLVLDNPFRHMVWLPVPLYNSVQDNWEKYKDKKSCIQIIETYINIYDSLREIFEADFLVKRKNVLLESLKAAISGYFTAASLLLYSQTEGILLDLAIKVNNNKFGAAKAKIFPCEDAINCYIDNNGKERELLSISNLLFDSAFRDFFWPGFIEYFVSDFYSERCLLAHGKVSEQLLEGDYKTISLFVITVCDIYGEFIKNGNAPVMSKLYKLRNESS